MEVERHEEVLKEKKEKIQSRIKSSLDRTYSRKKALILGMAVFTLSLILLGFYLYMPVDPVHEKDSMREAGELPGGIYYGLDRGVEQVRLDAAGGERKTKLKLMYSEERLSEALKLHKKGMEEKAAETSEIYTGEMNRLLGKHGSNSSKLSKTIAKHRDYLESKGLIQTDFGRNIYSRLNSVYFTSISDQGEKFKERMSLVNEAFNQFKEHAKANETREASSSIKDYESQIGFLTETWVSTGGDKQTELQNAIEAAKKLEGHASELEGIVSKTGEGYRYDGAGEITYQTIRDVHGSAVFFIVTQRDELPSGVEKEIPPIS
jgi:hypothetical protein